MDTIKTPNYLIAPHISPFPQGPMDTLTLEEKAHSYETMRHIEKVRKNLNFMVRELLTRGEEHDQSKMEHPEVEAFTKAPPIANIKYNSPEYNEIKNNLGPALEHHYSKNSHHPEFFKNGVRDMNLIDLIEMFCDWHASTSRNASGNLLKSIEINGNKYNMSSDLIDILNNTIRLLD